MSVSIAGPCPRAATHVLGAAALCTRGCRPSRWRLLHHSACHPGDPLAHLPSEAHRRLLRDDGPTLHRRVRQKRPRSQQPTRPSTAPEVPHAGAGLPPWALRGAPSPIWVPRSRLRRRSGALPKVADHAAFAHPGISINGEPVLNLRQMYALVQRLHGGCGMGQSCRPDKRQSWPPTARGALALGCRAELGLLGPLRAALEPLSPRRRPSR